MTERTSQLTEELKAHYAALAAKRKQLAIERREIRLRLDVAAIEGFLEFWNSWVAVLGLEAATDHLIEGMINEHELIRARLGYKGEPGRVTWVQVSAPKLQLEASENELEDEPTNGQ